MYISAIPAYRNNDNYKTKLNDKVKFGHHPDFTILAKKYNVTNSSYFRRGICAGINMEHGFQDIVNLFKKVFGQPDNKPQKMLIAGIGNSEEPFSYLAVIKDLTQNRKLSEVLNLNIVDLQSRPAQDKLLFEHSYYDFFSKFDYGSSSFVHKYIDKVPYGTYKGRSTKHYRVNDEIIDFLNSTYANSRNSLWETRIQEAITKYPDNNFDIISVNNTLCYIEDVGTRINTVKNIHRVLKPGGFYITDPHFKNVKEAGLSDKFNEIASGIFQKKD